MELSAWNISSGETCDDVVSERSYICIASGVNDVQACGGIYEGEACWNTRTFHDRKFHT